MSSFAINATVKATHELSSNNTLQGAQVLAELIGATIDKASGDTGNTPFPIIEHTTGKGKVIRGVVRTDLSYAEAKAIDEYTFKKGGGWFIREKHLTAADNQQSVEGQHNVPSSSNALEFDSQSGGSTDTKPGIENRDADGSGQSGRMAGAPIDRPDDGRGVQRGGSTGLPENDGAGLGARSDTSVSGGAGQRRAGKRDNATTGGGGDGVDDSRSPTVRERDNAVVRSAVGAGAANELKLAAQRDAEGTPTDWGNALNIDKALPYLLPEQRGDVGKAEKRLIDENKNGILFTNGTGTGKTFSGLGAIKRFASAGKKNILIVSMNDKIIKDFIKSAKSLSLGIHQLDGITDNGKDRIVATTYANLGQNMALGLRDWDMIVVDEAHNLMQGEEGRETEALHKLRALSRHHAGFDDWVSMRHADKAPQPVGTHEDSTPFYDDKELAAWTEFKKPLREQWQQTWASQPVGRTKVIFLTATPFSYVKTLEWAEGYLFDFIPPAERYTNKSETMGMAYNSGNAQEQFYMQNFGYRMRTNRLTRPDGKVDVGIMERKFSEKLKEAGALSGRDLSVPFDYDRKFVLIDSKIGATIDEGFRFLWDAKGNDGRSKYGNLLRELQRRFDYLARMQLLEAIKAQEAVDQIKKHLALGRKVIVFHDYNVGGATNPFVMRDSKDQAVIAEYDVFQKERPDLIRLKLDIPAPIVTLKKAFPNALLFNGTVSKGQRNKNADLFNADDSGHNIMIAQSDAAATGISFHDTTGTYQRVLMNIGMPTKPAKLRQTEGRIYRVGQASNAIQRYLTTGTDWERSTFSQKIAERAETVDNLAQGESAVVSIKDALVRAYEGAEHFEPSAQDGVGGKAYDAENARIATLSPFDRAKTEYWAKQKVSAKRSEREGKEWYATPEPVGLFMVNLSGAHTGDDILEPSAGDGAIGRYMPSDAAVTFVEPSETLASRARMNNTNASVIVDTFENLDRLHKYDAIVMNPPFGQGGSLAIKHLIKAFEHLRDGGRVVALLPVGNMDRLIDDYSRMGYFKDIYKAAEINLPACTFENAGTRVNTRIHIFERHDSIQDAPSSVYRADLSGIERIDRLFDQIENITLQPRKLRVDEALAEYGLEIYPNRSKYVVTGPGVKRADIVKTLFQTWDTEKNSDGDYVAKYNKGKTYLRWLSAENIPKMANLITADVARFDSLAPGLSFTQVMHLIKELADKKDDAVASELAKAIGIELVQPSSYPLSDELAQAGREAFAAGLPRNAWMEESWAQSPSAHFISSSWRKAYDSAKADADAVAAREGKDIVVLPSEYPTYEVNASYSHISHHGASRAQSDRDAFVAWINSRFDEAMAKADTPEQKDAARKAVVALKVEYLRRIQPVINTRSNTYSGHIAGGAKLNAKQANSRNSALDRALDTFSSWMKAAEGDVMQAVLDARSPEQLKAIADEKAAKAAAKVEKNRNFLRKLLDFKPGDTLELGNMIVERVNRDREGYPSSLIVRDKSGEPLFDNKVDLARTLYRGDKVKMRAEFHAAREAAAKDKAQGDSGGLTKESVFQHRLDVAQREIEAMMADGTIPPTVTDFSVLHDYIDANELINDADRSDRMIGPLGKELGWKQGDYIDFSNDLIEAIDGWLKARAGNSVKTTDNLDDVGGFKFMPAIKFDSVLNAIQALAGMNTLDNAKQMASLIGVKIKEEGHDLGFDLFGDPIQDGDESPVEELPRLAVVELPLAKLTLSEDVPQFKSGADDDTGVVEALGGKFDRTGVAPIQVWERLDGRLEIISGRHRTDLARRSGEKTIPAQVHKESEGFDAKKAMMLDAELNIRDGQGKVKDYVDYFTHSEIGRDEADQRGLLARSIGQRAFAIATQGSEELKTLHRNEVISDQAAADIANLVPGNAAMQAVGLRVLQEHKPLNNALNTIRAVMALTREKGQEPDTFDLFGFDDSALKEAEAMARIASRKQRQIAEQLTAIKGAVRNPKLAAKHGVIVENEADALAKVQAMTVQKARWDNWSSHADLLAEVRAVISSKDTFDSIIDGASSDGWIGVDLDGTLAKYSGWNGMENIGEPIPLMLERVKHWLQHGFDVRIFTARASDTDAVPYIKAWCKKHIGQELPVTNVTEPMIRMCSRLDCKDSLNCQQVD